MKTKIHRRCACGCGEVTNYGKIWIVGHHTRHISKEHKINLSLSAMGNTRALGATHSKQANKNKSLRQIGSKRSEETRLKMSLSMIKSHPNDKYCEAWRDKEFRDHLRKDYCENVGCENNYKELHNHHINLNKKDCRPCNIMTLCNSCHKKLHINLNGNDQVNYKNFITIIRINRIVYIHKATRKKIILRRTII